MVDHNLSENLKQFIFAYIDSAELLDVLLLMHLDRSRIWTAEKLGHELRTSTNSAAARLIRLKQLGLIEQPDAGKLEYYCCPHSKELDLIVHELAECNGVVRHRLLQLIFSPLKKGRMIADGFLVNPKKRDKGDEHG